MNTKAPSAASVPGGVSASRLSLIDVLRGVAVLVVVVVHGTGFAYGNLRLPMRDKLIQYDEASSLWGVIGHIAQTAGWVGVSAFFAISGFCIHYGYLRGSEGQGFASFMVRRIFRIMPAFIVSFVVVAMVVRPLIGVSSGVEEWFGWLVIPTLTFNAFGIWLPDVNPAYWTLPIEMQLYLLYFVVLALRRRWGIGITLALVAAPQIIYALIRAYGTYELGWHFTEPSAWNGSPFAYWFDWTVGAFVAERFFAGRRAFAAWVYPVALVAFVAAFVWHPAIANRYAIGAFACAVLLDARAGNYVAGMFGRLMSRIGEWSYSIYLWHMPVMGLMVGWLAPASDGFHDLSVFVATTAFGVLVIPLSRWTFIRVEKPWIMKGKAVASRLETVAR